MTDDAAASSSAAAAAAQIRQKLMTADEVYIYKIPPLKDAGGHRAEDWNLASPLKTCALLVERRGDALVLEFTHDKAVFAQAQINIMVEPKRPTKYWIEPVVDSSRYFVVKIGDASKGREAMIGFGFRDRELATDLREAIQHYEKAIEREYGDGDGKKLADYHVPAMNEGDTIHVATKKGGGRKSTITHHKQQGGDHSSKKAGVALLSKKPPPPAADTTAAAAPDAAASAKPTVEKVAISLGDIDLDADRARSHEHHHHGDGDGDGGGDDGESSGSSSGGAVYTGDDTQWANEFAMK